MNIKKAKEQIKNAIKAYFTKDEFGHYEIPIEKQRPIFLIGAPGIGKTAIMQQIAQEMNLGLVSYSMTHHTRQSALGLPFIETKEFDGNSYQISEYTMSEILAAVYKLREETGYQEGILFLDEINCVSETLAPSMLQFLQYKTFGTHHLPKGWIVVTAGNPPEYNRSVREFDIVTLDRLKRIDVEPDFDTWKEYAFEKGIHGAILTFLEIKKNDFYAVEALADRKSFVTARGWEDLSEMMKLYEKNDLEIDLDLILQYVQNPQIAKEFSLYYDLYKKYRSDYQILDILSGHASREIINRGQQAPFDERLSLLGLLLDTVDGKARDFMLKDKAILELLGRLKQIKVKLIEEGQPCQFALEQQIEDITKLLDVGQKAGALGKEQLYAYDFTLAFLKQQKQIATLEGKSEGQEAFLLIKQSYDARSQVHKDHLEEIKNMLSHLFGFVEEAFCKGQEMMLLVTELTVRHYSSSFITKFGCPEYFLHNEELMLYEKKQSILSQIDALS